jgi:hypothetical protein
MIAKSVMLRLIPERVGSTNSIELFTNGATAKKSLPKNLSKEQQNPRVK